MRGGGGGGASEELGGSTAIDDYQVWAHGFTMTATLHHSRRVLEALVEAPHATLDELCTRTRANSGHLAVMLRTLSTIGWVVRSPDGSYSTSRSVADCANSPTLAALCEDVYSGAQGDRADVAWGAMLPRLANWLGSIESGWSLPACASDVEHLPIMLCGAVIAPMLLELRMLSSSYTACATEGQHEHASPEVRLDGLDEQTATRVGSFFASQRWGAYEPSTRLLRVNELGLFLLER